MSAELIGIIAIGVSLGLFLWRVSKGVSQRIDRLSDSFNKLSDSHNQLSREFSELRGEVRARFGLQDRDQVNEVVRGVARQFREGGVP